MATSPSVARSPKKRRRKRRSQALDDAEVELSEIVAHAAELLPSQAPLHAFVHHNTLHAFEHLPFEQAVIEASRKLGTQPYQSESAFAECLSSGRITPADIEAVIAARARDGWDEPIVPGGPTRRELRLLRLHHLFEVPSNAALRWALDETDLLERFFDAVPLPARRRVVASALRCPGVHGSCSDKRALQLLWKVLADAAPGARGGAPGVRRRDQLFELCGRDCDDWSHPLLIRLCSAFVDQGVAYWEMPGRDSGLLEAFRRLYGLPAGPPDRWLRGLGAALRKQHREQWSAARTVRWALEELGHSRRDWPPVIEATLLSLRGWAGMIRQLELHPELAPVRAPVARLLDYLAVQLTLDLFAARELLRETLGESAQLGELEKRAAVKPAERDLALVYEAFVTAQLAGVGPAELAVENRARDWLREIADFDCNRRRELLHLAYERRHRIGVLDGLVAGQRLRQKRGDRLPSPRFMAVFCIDDREESLRRHLEELEPRVATFAYAGFFGVAMAYQGLEDVRPRNLCPVSIKPRHYVAERAADPQTAAAFAAARRAHGRLSHTVSVGSKTLTRGGLVAAGLGLAATVPLIGRCLFPRLTERMARATSHGVARRPPTRLAIERAAGDPPRSDGLLPGYTISEMTEIVETALRTIGLTRDFCPLIFLVGHGSSSLNNPHEAAHDCGATGGGRGGPNARAFAAMANEPRVRQELARRGLAIPDDTWFVGAYHNTCDDSVTYYDEDCVPEAQRGLLVEAKTAFAEACLLDAHERCRRFETAPTTMKPEQALAHAEAHAYDLAEPRPEYGHATNALCIVGRRERTRGLFLDRRVFLACYDPTQDPTGTILHDLLLSVGPVGAGISLEYYFSFVDPVRYGSGTKLPHNVVGLVGVMDGHASDLRTGLPWQMVEIHEPVRLLTIVEVRPEVLTKILARAPSLAALVNNRWIQLVAWDPNGEALWVYEDKRFVPYAPEHPHIAVVQRSADHYQGHVGHLPIAYICGAFAKGSAP